MKLRILTALPLAAAVVYLIVQRRDWLFTLAVLATIEISLHEFFHVARQAGMRSWPIAGYLGGALLCLGQFSELHLLEFDESVALLIVIIAIPVAGLLLSSDLQDYIGALATTLLGVFFVAFAFAWLIPLRFAADAGRNLVLLLFLVIWAEDIFAYLAGRLAGRTPLAPRISPKKTVEGAVAGLAGAVLVAWAFTHWFWQTGGQKTVILILAVVAVSGQLGDLVESALKRAANLKDSGTLLPGHGGMLDRIDSMLIGVPMLWLLWNLKDLWLR